MCKVRIGVIFAAVLLSAGCSTNALISDALSGALSGGEGGEHPLLSENDPDLVREALPFTLKLLDILISSDIRSPEILLTASQAYAANATLFLQSQANTTERENFSERGVLLDRAKIHLLRSRDYALAALIELNKDFDPETTDGAEFTAQLAGFTEEGDTPYLYFAAAAWFGAIALDIFDIGLALSAPRALALIDRAYEIDPEYNDGAISEFYILLYGGLPEGLGGDKELAKFHYERAVELSENGSAGAHVSYATVTALPDQDEAGFRELMERALDVDVDARPNSRLVNIIRQREAQWYLDNLEILFIDYGG